MKLQFKHQKFQADAAKAVVDVFAGQPYLTPSYMMDRGYQGKMQESGQTYSQSNMFDETDFTGWSNQRIVPELNNQIILDHIQKIQRNNQIEPSSKLEGTYNLTIEMETGVGKTYTYIKTMYELNKHYGWSKFIIVVPSIATVIASESYDKFAKGLQAEIAEAVGNRPRQVTEILFENARVHDKDGNEETIDASMARRLIHYMIKMDYIDENDALTDKFYEDKANGEVSFGTEMDQYKPDLMLIIDSTVFNQFKDNPEEFIIQAGKLINNEKATAIIQHITYDVLDDKYDTDIFTDATIKGKLDVNAMKADKHLFDHIIYDSTNERKFAQELDVASDVAVYVKLPDGFYISTPVGHYNPDWAIAFKEGTVKHIYFVAETKGSMDTLELRGIEDAKIHCAREHFKAISGDNVVYDVVDSYQALLDKVMR